MNQNHHQIEEEHYYKDSGYSSYPVSEGTFMGFFGGVQTGPPLHCVNNTGTMHDQESAYWSMHMNSYNFELSGSGSTSSYYGGSENTSYYGGSESTSYYGVYEDNGIAPSMDLSTRAWEYPSVATADEPMSVEIPPEQNNVVAVDIPSEQNIVTAVDISSEENAVPMVQSLREDGSPHHQDDDTTQVLWQDDIDPDSMTYEELLDLGEAVGAESRGLSQELINLLPTSKHKSGGIFSRKKSEDRCVICQTRYKRGDRQINLPCKHVYHTDCGSKWLRINKTCPVCNAEVFANESRQ